MTNRIFAALMAGVSTVATGATADDFSVEPAISKVVVYRNGGATVTRTGTLRLPAGRHTITADKLTRTFDEEQLTVSFDSSAVRLYSLDVDTSYSVTPGSDRQASLEAELDKIDAKDAELIAAEQAKNMQLAFLRTLNQNGGKADQALPFSDWQNALSFIGDSSVKVLGEIEEIKSKRKALNDQRLKLRRELANAGPKRTDYNKATFEVMVPKAQDVSYELSYFVEDAEWELGLEGALDTDAKSLSLWSRAIVSQETGEDWTDVSLALSNNEPSDDLGEISQHPRILSLLDPEEVERKSGGPFLEARRTPAPDQRGSAEGDFRLEEIVVATEPRAQSFTSTFDRLYEVSGTVSIPSTDEAEYVDLSDVTSPVSLVVRANPSVNTTAYLFADTELTDFESLRNVSPKLRRDGHYVGMGYWPNLEADTKLKLPYGADNAISIEYTEQAPEDGDSGLFGSKKVEEKRYVISVTNNHTSPMTVEIFDQVPVSGHEDVKVRTLSDATKPTETDMDDKQGLMMWRKTMAPGEVWKINHSYRVTYPSDMMLVGQ
ncbi:MULTISPECIES: mucoidy inhibitor MuiA family protein [Kordiimonas]|uniref:mucoidy inhibitor MuiA family protein n=1 Tax=Kordiimonas TaxID=288021 RepID=UPI00257BD9A8|nr:mucoidy inhibitor MuiA family protein [Kordiimonas sp. UBA4487]